MGLDPVSALATTVGDVITGWRKENHFQKWCSLCFQLISSMIGSFMLVCGTSLVSGVTTTKAIGSGMCMATISMYVILRKSDLTKGMLFVAPAQEGTDELNTNVDIIQRAK